MTTQNIEELTTAYHNCFTHPTTARAAIVVLKDLANFCNATKSSMYIGAPDCTAFEEGKRAVWLYITKHVLHDELQQLRLAHGLLDNLNDPNEPNYGDL
jgi:hypothetical protein